MLIATLALLLTAPAFARGIHVEPLTPAQIPALLKPPAQGRSVIMLWSLQCRYCEPNMRELARLQRAHPQQMQLVLVATNSFAAQRRIAARLAAAGMQGYRARAYSEPVPGRMNHLIDPSWGGELPRTIVIRADGTRLAFSGLLSAVQLARIAPH